MFNQFFFTIVYGLPRCIVYVRRTVTCCWREVIDMPSFRLRRSRESIQTSLHAWLHFELHFIHCMISRSFKPIEGSAFSTNVQEHLLITLVSSQTWPHHLHDLFIVAPAATLQPLDRTGYWPIGRDVRAS